MFEEGFPVYLAKELHNVLGVISIRTDDLAYMNMDMDRWHNEEYLLLDDSRISFPDRICFADDKEAYDKLTTKEEKLIYHCIFTRSNNGYVREKHLRAILAEDFTEWCFPYILKLSSEYVVELLDIIYEAFKEKDNSLFQAFCMNNPYMFRYCHSRMVSYWNEYYRDFYPQYRKYVGCYLYRDCFGYKKEYDRLR